MPGINDALAEIHKLNLGDKLVYTKIARKHGVDRNTLSRAHRGVQVPRRVANEHQHKLTLQQKEDLVQYIELLSARRLPPTRAMVQSFASNVAQNPCSES